MQKLWNTQYTWWLSREHFWHYGEIWSEEPTARPTFLEIWTQLKLLSSKHFDRSVTNSHQQNNSNYSWRSSNSQHINGGGFTRNYLSSYSHNYWLHVPHLSSNHSLNSSHHPASSLRNRDNLLPPSDVFVFVYNE